MPKGEPSGKWFWLFLFNLRLVIEWPGAHRMFGRKRNKDENRYYLLPGMGRANKRKRAVFFRWALVVGTVVSMLVGLFIYYSNRVSL